MVSPQLELIDRSADLNIRTRPVDPALGTQYIFNSLPLEGSGMEEIKKTAKQNNIAVVLGFSERTPSNSLYIANAIISPQGEIVLSRKKIKPTHMERTVYGDGNGEDLNNVVEIDFGEGIGRINIGVLNCWEHTQPLLKYHTHAQREQIHIAMWPPLDPHGGVDSPMLWSMSAEGCINMSQTYAIEGGTYVLHCSSVITDKGIEMMKLKGGIAFQEPGGGASAVIGPDGRRLTKPLNDADSTTEGLVIADLDLNAAVANRSFFDVVGHYSRPDLLWLGVDKQQKKCVVSREPARVE